MSSISELLATSGLPTRAAPIEILADGVRAVYVNAGHVYVSAEPTRITAVLGSSVAIGLWDAAAGVGGMNHYMLPHDIGTNCATPRYARYAMERLLAGLLAAGAQKDRLQAKLFGGACVMAAFRAGGADLGSKNLLVARQHLSTERIPVVTEETGGAFGRRVLFRTDTGEAVVRNV